MYYNSNTIPYNNGDRQFFFPFLLGGLAGAGLVGVSRPRPVYVNPPVQQYPYSPGPYPYRPTGYYNYNSGAYY